MTDTNTNTRTPGPWEARTLPALGKPGTVLEIVAPDYGVIVARIPEWGIAAETPDAREANAAFIVRACNAWDNVEELRARIAELEQKS